MSIELSQHISVLTDFAHAHFTGDEQDDDLIRLKLDHSLHVHETAEDIIRLENITGKIADHCRLAALYHDIGRFPQFAQYRTFNDRESINHGRMGVRTLRPMSLPGALTQQDWRIIRLAVGQHNIKSIKSSLPEPYATPVKLVRDADKIDIFRVMVDHFSSDDPEPKITFGHEDLPGYYTQSVYDSVLNGEKGDYSFIQCENDFKLLILGWLPYLHFPASIRILAKSGHINDMFSFLPKDEKIESLREKIDIFLHYNKL